MLRLADVSLIWEWAAMAPPVCLIMGQEPAITLSLRSRSVCRSSLGPGKNGTQVLSKTMSINQKGKKNNSSFGAKVHTP
jgi:hypothetical protein